MRAAKFGLAAMAGAILASHGAAAQSIWYISGSAGVLFVPDYSRSTTIFNSNGLQGPGTNTSTYDPGETFNVALGYRLPLGLRIEAELGFQHFDIDTINPLSTDGTFPNITGKRLSSPSGGDHERFTGTVNVFYDLPVTFSGITPYIGAGAGYYHATSSNAVFANGDSTFTQRGSSGNNAIVLAEIGASYALTPQLSLTLAYRYEYFAGSSLHNANIVKFGLRYSF